MSRSKRKSIANESIKTKKTREKLIKKIKNIEIQITPERLNKKVKEIHGI